MDQGIKEAWRKLLDTETQGTGALCQVLADGSRTYCCWGLYMEVLVARGLATRTVPVGDAPQSIRYRLVDGDSDVWAAQDGYSGYPSRAALAVGDIPTQVAGTESTIHLFAGQNDSGSNFAAISAMIEELL